MSGRGPGTAVPPGAAGGSQIKRLPSNTGLVLTHHPWPRPIRDIEHPTSFTQPDRGFGHIAEVTSDRTNLSPFTKDYRGAAS